MSVTVPTYEKLAITKEAVDQYCRDCGIDDADEREYVAHLANSLFDIGETSVEKLLAALEYTIGPARRQALDQPTSAEPSVDPASD
jgi:hypothetical protein